MDQHDLSGDNKGKDPEIPRDRQAICYSYFLRTWPQVNRTSQVAVGTESIQGPLLTWRPRLQEETQTTS